MKTGRLDGGLFFFLELPHNQKSRGSILVAQAGNVWVDLGVPPKIFVCSDKSFLRKGVGR
jgi:hypothetical protein